VIRLGRHLPGRCERLPGLRAIQARNHRPWFPPFDRGRWQFFLDDTGCVPIRALAARAAIIRDADLRPRLADIAAPVLLVRCEGDGRVLSRCEDELEAALPDARSETLTGCGQLPFLTHPHRLAKSIREFLQPAACGEAPS
ncbi:MAG: alpha/beta fold hydrolase, partial [Planctomycetaceae bacterium]